MMETIDLLEEGLIVNAAERGDQGLRACGRSSSTTPTSSATSAAGAS